MSCSLAIAASAEIATHNQEGDNGEQIAHVTALEVPSLPEIDGFSGLLIACKYNRDAPPIAIKSVDLIITLSERQFNYNAVSSPEFCAKGAWKQWHNEGLRRPEHVEVFSPVLPSPSLPSSPLPLLTGFRGITPEIFRNYM